MPIRLKSGSPLKETLDKFYDEYDFRERIKHDPIEFPHRYSRPEDIEVAGFIASCFAYGKVGLFKPVIEKILKPGGKHPAGFIRDFDLQRDKKSLHGISYRFNKEKDVLCLIYILNQTLGEFGSLKNLFYHSYNPSASPLAKGRIKEGDEDIGPALSEFVNYLLSIDTSPVYGKNIKPDGVKQLFPSPENGSACKRVNLFLRWMVRRKDIDFGIWNKITPSKLIIPLDVHIARISRCLGLTKRKASDWKTAKEITRALKKFDPDDPLKYDFALCHQGISRMCRGEKFKDTCTACAIIS
ncbi:MAG: TIGR02757 family protein [Nitrospirae bacterium]|nr:TIGR02757 family protein [Nitrospirota bacterium]